MMWILWLCAALILALVEVLVVDLVFLMLAGGALAATVAAAAGAPLPVQVIVFAVVAALLLIAIRPWALRRFRTQTPEVATNTAALVGQPAVVTEAVSERDGRVKLDGEVWSARLSGAGVLEAGTEVRVLRIEGAAAIVAPASEIQDEMLTDPPPAYPTPDTDR